MEHYSSNIEVAIPRNTSYWSQQHPSRPGLSPMAPEGTLFNLASHKDLPPIHIWPINNKTYNRSHNCRWHSSPRRNLQVNLKISRIGSRNEEMAYQGQWIQVNTRKIYQAFKNLFACKNQLRQVSDTKYLGMHLDRTTDISTFSQNANSLTLN